MPKHYSSISNSQSGRELWDKLFVQQNGCCAICGDGLHELVIDHDHSTNLVRGLLCRSCNAWMGHHLDKEHDHDFLRKALQYLTHPPTKSFDDHIPKFKYCKRGDHTLPASEFYQYKRHGRMKLSGYCKACTQDYHRERQAKLKESE